MIRDLLHYGVYSKRELGPGHRSTAERGSSRSQIAVDPIRTHTHTQVHNKIVEYSTQYSMHTYLGTVLRSRYDHRATSLSARSGMSRVARPTRVVAKYSCTFYIHSSTSVLYIIAHVLDKRLGARSPLQNKYNNTLLTHALSQREEPRSGAGEVLRVCVLFFVPGQFQPCDSTSTAGPCNKLDDPTS